MATPNPSLREQGAQAFQQGDLDRAADMLARAVMNDDQDADAKALLGIVYSQKGLHDQAKRALQSALILQPRNTKFLFNLGIACERAGDMQGAAIAYRDALQVEPQNAQARARLQAMGPQAQQLLASAPKPPPEVGVPVYGQPVPDLDLSSVGLPPGGPLGAAAPPPTGLIPGLPTPPPATPYTPGGATMVTPSLGGGLVPQEGPPGTVKCPNCGQWVKPGLSCEFCSAALRPPSPAPPPPPMPASVAYQHAGAQGPGVRSPTYFEDRFNVGEGFQDLFHVLISPRDFFSDQEGREGLAAPLSFLFACAITVALPMTIVRWIKLGASLVGRGSPFIGIGCGWIGTFIILAGFVFVAAGVLHLVCKMFGGQGGYSASFRAVSYGGAPLAITWLLAMIIANFSSPLTQSSSVGPQPGAGSRVVLAQIGGPGTVPRQFGPGTSGLPGSSGLPGGSGFPRSPFSTSGPSPGASAAAGLVALVVLLPGYIWHWILLGMSLPPLHGMSGGAAAGAVVVYLIAFLIAVCGLGFLFGALILGIVSGLTGGAGAVPK
jgi:tetratricopeptide (TPR) repeat protein